MLQPQAGTQCVTPNRVESFQATLPSWAASAITSAVSENGSLGSSSAPKACSAWPKLATRSCAAAAPIEPHRWRSGMRLGACSGAQPDTGELGCGVPGELGY